MRRGGFATALYFLSARECTVPVEIKTIPEGSLTIPQEDFDTEVRTSFHGSVFTPDDPGYEDAPSSPIWYRLATPVPVGWKVTKVGSLSTSPSMYR